jgi:hypothetical protein
MWMVYGDSSKKYLVSSLDQSSKEWIWTMLTFIIIDQDPETPLKKLWRVLDLISQGKALHVSLIIMRKKLKKYYNIKAFGYNRSIHRFSSRYSRLVVSPRMDCWCIGKRRCWLRATFFTFWPRDCFSSDNI